MNFKSANLSWMTACVLLEHLNDIGATPVFMEKSPAF